MKKIYHRALLKTRALKYRGNRYYCACCQCSYRDFLDMKEGSHPRPNVVCPGCGAVERHRMLRRYLEENQSQLFPSGTRIMYVAPMFGIQKYLSQIPNTSYLDVDLSSPFAQEHFDLMDIPHPNDSFDFCICSHTLAHITDDIQALSELYRVLSPKGKLIIMERIYDIPSTHDLKKSLSNEERLAAYEQEDRWRMYGKNFARRIASVGFQVEVSHYAKQLPPDVIQRERLDASEIIFIAHK